MNRFDQLLNQFLDKEISQTELDELNEYLTDESNRLKLIKASELESLISKVEIKKTPNNTTKKIMARLASEKLRHSIRGSSFALWVNVSFVFLLLIFVGLAVLSADWNSTNEISFHSFNKFILKSSELAQTIYSAITSKSVVIIGIVSSLILIINFIFNYEVHRSFIRKLNQHLN